MSPDGYGRRPAAFHFGGGLPPLAPKSIGRPRTVRPATGDLLSRGPRMEVMLDADADLALIRLRAETKRPKAECVRLLLRAWNEDTGMKRAFDGWRKGAGK